MCFEQFIATVYLMATADRWAEMNEYFVLVKELRTRPTAEITVGTVKDKEVA